MFMKWSMVNSPRRKRTARIVLTAALAAVMIIQATGCALLPDEDAEEKLPAIQPPKLSQKPEFTVTTTTLETTVNGTGKLMSEQEETIFFTLENKRLKELYVKIGDKVTKGQVIAELDVSDLQQQLRQKQLEFRKEELAMIETLRSADEKEPSELEQAKINFEMKRTELTDLQEEIAKAKLTAPFNGTIVSLNVDKGAEVKAYDPVAVIADMSKLTVAAKLDDVSLKSVAPGMDVVVDINAAGQFKGKVERLPLKPSNSDNNGGNGGGFPGNPGNSGDPNQQDSIEQYLLVKLNPFPPNLVRDTPLSVSIVTQRKENVMVIPPSALNTYGGRNYVKVVEKDGTKREADVEIGQQTATEVEIVKGLQPGQKVVGR